MKVKQGFWCVSFGTVRGTMAGYGLFRALLLKPNVANTNTRLCVDTLYRVPTCGYAKKPAAKVKSRGIKEELKSPEVCKDTVMLTTHAVGVNILKQGEDPQLKPAEEYPEWLFNINLGPAKKLEELDEDSWEYWKRLRKENIWRFNRLSQGKKLC